MRDATIDIRRDITAERILIHAPRERRDAIEAGIEDIRHDFNPRAS